MTGLLGHNDIEVDLGDPRLWQKLMVQADHPIFKRIDKVIQPYQMESLVLELIEAGYENINISAHKGGSE